MRTRGDGCDSFGVCDFCDTDASDYKVKWVKPIGDKGICSRCAKELAALLAQLVAACKEKPS